MTTTTAPARHTVTIDPLARTEGTHDIAFYGGRQAVLIREDDGFWFAEDADTEEMYTQGVRRTRAAAARDFARALGATGRIDVVIEKD
jgi:hypothetical protein